MQDEGPKQDSEPQNGSELVSQVSRPQEKDGLSVTELLNLIEGVVLRGFPDMLWVVGEVQNLNDRRGKSVFFQVAEQGSESSGDTCTISAVIWPGVLKSLDKKFGAEKIWDVLQDGLTVRLLCRVNFYKGRGTVSLAVHDVDPSYTKGALALAREQLLRELRGKGLDCANGKRPLPIFPFRVGLISAEQSRAESDFLHQLAMGKFCGEILYCPTTMQGDRAPKEVTAALTLLISHECDVIVLTRGGGSAADLRWFDTPEIAYAIAHCPIPVVAAIGHHDDRCIAEEVCYERQKTPTAAADFILSRFEEARKRLEQSTTFFRRRLEQVYVSLLDKQAVLNEKLTRSARETLGRQREKLSTYEHQIERKCSSRLSDFHGALSAWHAKLALHSGLFMQARAKTLDEQLDKLEWQTKLRLERLFTNLEHWQQKVRTLDPRPWLEKGWTQLWKGDNKVTSIAHVELGEHLTAKLSDGLLIVQVEKKEGTMK